MRVRLHIDGTVQGVGFRPYVYRLAHDMNLGGFVRNDARGAVVELEGSCAAIDTFVQRLGIEQPPLVQIEHITREDISEQDSDSFVIQTSTIVHPDDAGVALVPPDVATCDDCIRELFDPADRRYRYPFVNCTNCGPRFTIIRGTPYDRPLTTMATFRMCPACRHEYEDPANRRFHAQPNACPACGPRARLTDAVGAGVETRDAADAVSAAAHLLRDGAIVAVKGVGGYHVACLARDESAVQRLRDRKHRPHKPFAVMAPDLVVARNLIETSVVTEQLLASRERPIVLARRRDDAPVAGAVAPCLLDLGVMLPSSPLHQLLLHDVGSPVVMTSGNLTDEPIAFRDDEARERLSGIADYFLSHDRTIETPTDDSVVRAVTVAGHQRAMMIRRSRGYAPSPLALPVAATTPLLACGAQLKNTFCLARGTRAWVGPHVGDLERYESLRAYRDGIAHHERLFGLSPTHFAHDLHPEYLSTKYALERAESGATCEAIAVQHHHAHLAACLAEHGETRPAIGVIFDGTGLGTDGELWGGEILVGDLVSCERVGHLQRVRMPGGEGAVREPWRMACSWLSELHPESVSTIPAMLRRDVDERSWRSAVHLVRSGLASPRTSSAGRLLDAMAALCGIRARITYEGQAAIEFEAVADWGEKESYRVLLCPVNDLIVLDVRSLVAGVVADLALRVPVAAISARVHNSLARAAADCCAMLAASRSLGTVVISGGVFQNLLLLQRTILAVEEKGLRVLVPERIPPNDGGIAFGQTAIAAARAFHPERERL